MPEVKVAKHAFVAAVFGVSLKRRVAMPANSEVAGQLGDWAADAEWFAVYISAEDGWGFVRMTYRAPTP